jgi:hypothetical protein
VVRSEKATDCRFHRGISAGLTLLLLTSYVSPLTGQSWNAPQAITLVRRAVVRRLAVQADSALTSYRARAHGFVFFLAQVGEGLAGPPKLVKADELEVEVYWHAPNISKQVILGWRDGTFLPTDIRYHRDHLGIVTNNFGNVIRIGEGDEVRDVPHPLSPRGMTVYDFALVDSAAIRTLTGEVTVHQIQVRPRSVDEPLVIGTLYLDVATAELVRFRFSFTPPSYLDRQLEDISVVLENALYEGRYWLPYRQEVEIRRRVTWLDFPARGIIRGRWEIEEYQLNHPIPIGLFSGPAIAGLLEPGGEVAWERPLEEAIAGEAQPFSREDMESLRTEVERIAGTAALAGLPSQRLATGSLSDIARVNRVQGLALGIGGIATLGDGRIRFQPSLAYGTSDDRLLGSFTVRWRRGPTQLGVSAARQIRDFSELAVIAPVTNSLLAQEAGKDYGDYVLLHAVEAEARQHLGARTWLTGSVGLVESHSVQTRASPAHGTYRSNPALGAGYHRVARLGVERAAAGARAERDFQARLSVEGAEGSSEYVRVAAQAQWRARLDGSEVLARIHLGVGTDELPAYRSYVIGGRGTLVGEPFRKFGGREVALAHLEWRLELPVPGVALGSYVSTGRHLIVAPFLAAGYTGRPFPGQPWTHTDGIRPVAGLALEWLMGLVRVEAGLGLRDGTLGLTVDFHRDWWGLL